jgi:ribosomal protein S18 acetylase RimI-like enzyme
MELDDLAEVYHLGEDLFKAEETPSMYRTWDAFEVAELFCSDTEYCLVAETDDTLIGFALGTTITKSHSAWKYGHLIWLGVKTEFQRLNVAERLFQRFKDIMIKDGVRMLIVDTAAENLPGLHFFRKMGFGSPRQHIYLSMNLAAEYQRLKTKENGTTPPGNHNFSGKK